MRPAQTYQQAHDSSQEDEDQGLDMDDSGYSSGLKGPDPSKSWVPVFCTAHCCCHWAYVFLFLSYLVIFPLWCKWLLTAPMPWNYWGQGYPDFPRLELRHSGTARAGNNGKPQIEISPIPTEQSACNYTCSLQRLGYRTSEMNFEVSLKLNKPDLAGHAHSTYPVLLTSEDFVHWMLVADRRHASPTPFFNEVTDNSSRVYESIQDSCSKEPSGEESFTVHRAYIVACVIWESAAAEAIEKLASVATEDLTSSCNALGGVCGWPCSSGIASDSLPSCSAEGVIDQAALDKILDKTKTTGGNVSVHGCLSATTDVCATSTEAMSQWPCHQCEVKLRPERRLQPGMPRPPAPPALPGFGGDDDEADGGRGGGGGGADEGTEKIYKSLPRLMVKFKNGQVPDNLDIMTSPRAYILAAQSLQGPWEKIYAPIDPASDFFPPTPVGVKEDEDTPATIEDDLRTMTLVKQNRLTLDSGSCFGKRGPLYVVACAVNQSTYDDAGQWKNSLDNKFTPGQKVMPPPFNDRCVAVAGRCGHACEVGGSKPLPHCLPNGYINISALVGEIEVQYNRTPAVYCFVYVLLFGFAVKTIMLCPGVFQPYRRCRFYDPDLTEQLRYILVVGVTGGGDEGKGTMIRNTIGMVSTLPPECRCKFVVCNNEEGHRLEMMICWQRFTQVMAAIPNFGGSSYEENLRQFTLLWCDETRQMKLAQVGGNVKKLDPKILERLSGKTTVAKVKKSCGWDQFGPGVLDKLEAAVDALHRDLDTDYNKFTQMTPHLDYVKDWAPPDPNSTALRMHFTSRAKPIEDHRNIMVQHVAVGTWFYKVPPNATPAQWLELRRSCREMLYNEPDDDDINVKVPLRSSHGKAGGLNFVDNYITITYNRPENTYVDQRGQPTEQNEAPSLYAIADARHQFQPDFMISCVPCFFTEDMQLNHRVAFTQAPQHYPEYLDKNDYLDNNNAQFFRLNAMIRDCCGGVSSCGTNGMWQIAKPDSSTVWQRRLKRVRDRDHRRRSELIEREQFHTSCKIEDTASSLDRVLVGEYSHFVNRKLSFGMSKSAEGFLGAQQRWVEGAVTLCLQWVTQNADAHGLAKRNGPLLWCVIVAFGFFVYALCRLVTVQYTSSIFVELGLMKHETFDKYILDPFRPLVSFFYRNLLTMRGGHSPNSKDYKVYEDMTLQFMVWLTTCVAAYLVLWLLTNFCKCFKRCCVFPYEMKWWGRLIISFDNLTYWMWFWTSFFWIGFNVYLAVHSCEFHFHNLGMMTFMLVATFLNYALLFSNSLRFSIVESIDANEIAFLSMDNIWRANQLFFMVGPIQGFSVITGSKNFMNYLLYGQDIGGWSGGDLTQTSIAIVKYWTTMIIISSILCWIWLFASHPTVDEYQSRRPGCIIFTFIAMDVLHPCVYLWTFGNRLTDEEASKMTWCQALLSAAWWKRNIALVVLNETTTNMFRYVAPIYNFVMPILVFYNAYFGVTGGFTLVAVGAGH